MAKQATPEETEAIINNVEDIERLAERLPSANIIMRTCQKIKDVLKGKAPELNIETSTLSQLIETSLKGLETHGTAITLEIDNPDQELRIDQDLIANAIANLVRNACEALKEHTAKNPEIKPTVTIEASIIPSKNGQKQLRLKITDNGPGMDKEKLEELLATTQEYVETEDPLHGHGLRNTVRAINRHGGKIEAKTEKNEGTSFTMLIPTEAIPAQTQETPPPPVAILHDFLLVMSKIRTGVQTGIETIQLITDLIVDTQHQLIGRKNAKTSEVNITKILEKLSEFSGKKLSLRSPEDFQATINIKLTEFQAEFRKKLAEIEGEDVEVIIENEDIFISEDEEEHTEIEIEKNENSITIKLKNHRKKLSKEEQLKKLTEEFEKAIEGREIVVIDDAEENHIILKRMLKNVTEKAPTSYHDLASATVLLERIKNGENLVIILDEILPDGKGSEFARELRAQFTASPPTIIYYSNHVYTGEDENYDGHIERTTQQQIQTLLNAIITAIKNNGKNRKKEIAN